MLPQISIIVPVYKVEEYLSACLDSVLGQTFTDFELILVDDGSPDRCPEICDEYAKKDNRIRVIHKKNGGLSSARNAGLEICRGEYVTFVDSDDFIHEKMLEILLNIVMQNDADVSIIPCVQFKDGTELSSFLDFGNCDLVMKKKGSDFLDELLYGCCWEACGKLYKKKLFRGNLFLEGYNCEDLHLIPRIILESKWVVYLKYAKLYYYRIRENSVMSNDLIKTDMFVVVEDNLEYVKKYNLETYFLRFYSYFIFEKLKSAILYHENLEQDFIVAAQGFYRKRKKEIWKMKSICLKDKAKFFLIFKHAKLMKPMLKKKIK